MSYLMITLLGSFQVILDGVHPAALGYDKARALLAYLAVEAGRPHRRECLAGLLWPDRPEQRARQSLSQALYDLRHAIVLSSADPPFLLSTYDTVQFNPDCQYDLDVAEFLALADQTDEVRAVQALEDALALYRGPFPEGFSLSDSPAYEEWITMQRERFQRLALRLCSRLVEAYLARGRPNQGLRHARRQLELDPWREVAHQQVMFLLALSGRRSEALAHFEICRRILAEDLGIEPACETIRLRELIRSEQVERWGSPAAGSPA